MQSQEDREREWVKVAAMYARYPSQRGRAGLLAFSMLALVSLPCSLLIVVPADVLGVSAKKATELSYIGMGFLGLSSLMALLALLQWRSMRSLRALRDSFASAAEQRGGQVLDGPQLAQWLVRYWNADYPALAFASTPEICRAAFEIQGAPVLIDITPRGYQSGGDSGQSYWWARVVVATDRPVVGVRFNPEHPAVEQIRRLDLEAECAPAGVIARGSSAMEKSVRKGPTAVTVDIFETAIVVAQLATAVHADGVDGGVPLLLPWSGEKPYAVTQREEVAATANRKRLGCLLVALVLIGVASVAAAVWL